MNRFTGFRTALAAVVIVSTALARADSQSRPNIVWINCEDIGPALGCYGDPNAVTPRLDALARDGILYRNAFATAPICAPSRSCLITGVYATSLGTQHLRSEVRLPASVRPLPHLLRARGWFTTNSGKADYNFDPTGVWDHWSSEEAPWRKRRPEQPFFSVITIGTTHEGRVNFVDRYEQAVAGMAPERFHDPMKIEPPPFYPDTPAVREIFAHQHDLISRMDEQVGRVLDLLEEDGLVDDTVVFFFSDHGFGLPRYKRWLNDSGIRVPLIVRVPPRFAALAPSSPGSERAELVSFVDFAPTVLRLAGLDAPSYMQGRAFLGAALGPARTYVFAARSRADDMYEVSRAVHDGRFLYVRHFMPHLPYIQPGRIQSDEKSSYRELRRAYRAGELGPEAAAMWQPRKPLEELYDLESDPHELRNLAHAPSYRDTLARLQAQLRHEILESRDVGFLHEAEAHRRAAESSPYEVAQDRTRYDLQRILETAALVGSRAVAVSELVERLEDEDSGVRFWAATALLASRAGSGRARKALRRALDDDSPSVAITAAEALAERGELDKATPVLRRYVEDERPRVALQAARAIFLAGADATRPLVPSIRRVLASNRAAPGSGKEYKDFNYAAFTSWALEEALAALETSGADGAAPQSGGEAPRALVPRIEGEWWQVAGNPDLGELTGTKQQPVDFGIWQAADGRWQLWSCIRSTRVGGKTRLFHGWESPGTDITARDWTPRGVVMQADPAVGETLGGLQAPHVVVAEDLYHMFYGDWQHICLATSRDGRVFERRLQGLGKVAGLFDEAPHANTRDPMLIRIGDTWHCYYTAMLDDRGSVFCRTSKDFTHWSDSTEVAFGGRAGTKWWHAECPHVVERGGSYYLFRTQNYLGKPRSMVYRSSDPLDFGIEDDSKWVCELPIAAPEIVEHEGRDYVAALNPQLDGIRIARLEWSAP